MILSLFLGGAQVNRQPKHCVTDRSDQCCCAEKRHCQLVLNQPWHPASNSCYFVLSNLFLSGLRQQWGLLLPIIHCDRRFIYKSVSESQSHCWDPRLLIWSYIYFFQSSWHLGGIPPLITFGETWTASVPARDASIEAPAVKLTAPSIPRVWSSTDQPECYGSPSRSKPIKKRRGWSHHRGRSWPLI